MWFGSKGETVREVITCGKRIVLCRNSGCSHITHMNCLVASVSKNGSFGCNQIIPDIYVRISGSNIYIGTVSTSKTECGIISQDVGCYTVRVRLEYYKRPSFKIAGKTSR